MLDNLNIHRRKSLTGAFGVAVGGEIWDRFTVHYTPTHGSCLNQAEIEIGIFSRLCLGKGEFTIFGLSAGKHARGIGG